MFKTLITTCVGQFKIKTRTGQPLHLAFQGQVLGRSCKHLPHHEYNANDMEAQGSYIFDWQKYK